MSVIEANWNFRIDRNEIVNKRSVIELEFNNLRDYLLQILDSGFLNENINNKTNSAHIYDEEAKLVTEVNKELRQKIDIKRNELCKIQTQYENYNKDQKLLAQQIKKTHEAFLMAKKYYKKFLKMYFSIENRNNKSLVILVQFFTEAKKDTENYSARFIKCTETGHYELLSAKLKPKMLKELQRKLAETNDVPGAVCCIRQAFMAIKEGKKIRKMTTK